MQKNSKSLKVSGILVSVLAEKEYFGTVKVIICFQHYYWFRPKLKFLLWVNLHNSLLHSSA